MDDTTTSSTTASSIEKQIDNFLENFKRSASKAMDADWSGVVVNAASSAVQGGSITSGQQQLRKNLERNADKDLDEIGVVADADVECVLAESRALAQSVTEQQSQSTPSLPAQQQPQQQQQQQPQQLMNDYMLESQSSGNSFTSVQTVCQKLIEMPGDNTNSGSRNSSGSIIDHDVPEATVTSATIVMDSVAPEQNTASTSTRQNSEHINFLLEHINTAATTSSTTGSGSEGVLNIGDVADLLHPQHAIITGGRSQEGCPLIIFPDNNNFQILEEVDYQKLILYLTSVPSLQDADLGFHLIIDRRKDKWMSVKAVLQRISIYFPGIIHVVYVLRPAGLFQKAISEVSTKFSRDEYRFRLVTCSTLGDLHEFIDTTQLTADMGGTLIYSHHEWIQQRISLEKFSSLTHQVSAELDVFIQAIHDTEFPNSVEATQKLLDTQGVNYERLKEEILAASKHGEALLNNIKLNDELKEFSERTGNVSAIERLLVQLEETERRFDEFWRTHRHRLQQCLQLRRFEHDFRDLQATLDAHLKSVAEMTEIGESVDRVNTLIGETQQLQQLSSSDIARSGEVIAAGQRLISLHGVYPWEIVAPKCDELQRVCDIIVQRLIRRLEVLLKNRELMERVEKANQWCTNGVELLASQRIEKCSASPELAEHSLREIQAFISSASEFKLSSPSEFKKIFLESTTPETKALVSQVLQRIDDVSLMCDKRIASLKQLAMKPARPVQTVIPEPAVPLQPSGGAPHLLRRKHKAYVMHELRPRSMEGAVDSGVSLNGDNGSSPDGSEHMENQQDTEGRRLKRGHVLTELLETERIYVNEMNSILKGYCAQMQSDDMSHLVPASLKGKEEILFGNLHELYTFHSEVFLRDLENCISTTELVALCFVQRRDTFYRFYSVYCQNIPRSDRLRETLTDAHFFLQECQKRLGHKLPLGAYLLKPVQRITKYQLLLKDLLRFSDSGSCTKELQRALDCMLIVLKCVNDSMHQVAITGFPNELSQLGELLLQDSFQVWSESKKDIRLRIKPQQRHIFLYRKSMLFCKQLLKPGHNKSTYQFKHHLKMSQIGLTESIRGDTKRFEVWLQGRQEVHTLQAPTIEIKNKWVTEIKRVLLNQLEELKDEKIKQYGLSHIGLRQHGSWDASNIVVGSGNLHNINCDVISSSSSNRNSNCSSSGDDNCSATAISRPSIDREQQEACGWSSDYSNSEDELSTIEDNSTPGSKFVALADYTAITHSEVSMHEGDNIELLKVGCGGWWYIRVLDDNVEGWAPAAYLESLNRKAFRNSTHSQEPISQPKAND